MTAQVEAVELVGAHPSLLAVLQRADRAAPSTAPVLIIGERGTGAAGLAERIHAGSRRSAGPFVRVRCGQTPLVAAAREARGGTLFLDGVRALPAREQIELAGLLRVRKQRDTALARSPRRHLRVIAASDQELGAAVETGTFRRDLRYLLDVVRLDVPPLRMRRSDIPDLVTHFLRRTYEVTRRPALAFTEPALAALRAYTWPGNVHELEWVVAQAAAIAATRPPDLCDLPPVVTDSRDDGEPRIPGSTIAELERHAIELTIAACGGATERAARQLGVSRRTLQQRIRGWRG